MPTHEKLKLHTMIVVLGVLRAVSPASGGGAGLLLEPAPIVVDEGLDDDVRVGFWYGLSQDAGDEKDEEFRGRSASLLVISGAIDV